MKTTTLVDRFGSNRMNAHKPAELFHHCTPKVTCIDVPFAGGMCEVAWFVRDNGTSPIINANDLDRHVMNLAYMVRLDRARLVEQLDATPFHPDVLVKAQEFCKHTERWLDEDIGFWGGKLDTNMLVDHREWAYHYFVASWMTRGGKMGTKGEFEQGLSVRWKSGGGDSVVRFRSATESLAEWQKVMQKCTFHTLDCFAFLGECKKRDIKENGIYCDPPWPEDGENYVHKFTVAMHEKLARSLSAFKNARIVVRLNAHPLVRDLYREPRWTWNLLTSRTQANNDKAEVLLTNWKPYDGSN